MRYLMLIILMLLAIEDIRYRSVSVWQVMIFGAVCVCTAYFENRLFQFDAQGSIWGAAVGLFVIILIVLKVMGMGDLLVLSGLGIALGGLKIIFIILWADILLLITIAVLFLLKKINRNTRLPFIPYLCVAVFGVVICN